MEGSLANISVSNIVTDPEKPTTVDSLKQYIKALQDINADNTTGYVYTDSDTQQHELAELYSYSEEKDFTLNMRAFEDLLISFHLPPNWRLLTLYQKKNTIMRLLNRLEVNNVNIRMEASRCILYIVQGCWGDLHSTIEQIKNVRDQVIFLYQMGTFSVFIDLLKIEIDKFHKFKQISTTDSERLRVILAVLYTIMEILRNEKENKDSPYRSEIEAFISDLLTPIKGELLIVTLFDALVTFTDCSSNSSNFPIKKLLLLLWKLILLTLGGLHGLDEEKKRKRMQNGLAAEHNFANENHNLDILNLGLENLTKKFKVTQEEYEEFLHQARIKFIGYSVLNDYTTTAGLPPSICATLEIIRKYIYVPLGQVQIEKENHPLTNFDDFELSPTEIYYQAMHPKFEVYIVAIKKILNLAVQNNEKKIFTCKAQIEKSVEIHPIVLIIDIFRHEEIILKAISAIMLLLLKHLKLNNIYQFEYMCQCLFYNDILPILISFFNQNVSTTYVKIFNNIPILEFPNCIMGYQSEITVDTSNLTKSHSFSTRNMFVCINFLRILNKITKWKPARISELIVVDSKTILRRLISVNNETFKLYALKLLKMQMKYLGKTWRKNNIKILAEIYLRVRLHLSDIFLTHLSNECPIKKLEKHNKEIILRKDINRFNRRRYMDFGKENKKPVDKCSEKISGRNWEFPDCFKHAWLQQWLKQEILS